MRKKIVLLSRPALLCLLLFAVPSAFGQVAPSRITPRTLVPLRSQADGAIDLPDSVSAEAPPGSDQILARISDVHVDGGLPEFTPAIDAIAAGISHRDVRVSELYAAAAQIEAIYASAGFVLTRVTVPPQSLRNGGTLKLLVVDGFIESVDVRGVSDRVRGAVRRRAAKLIGRRWLSLQKIERAVLLAGDIPGVSLRSTLVRGTAAGAAQLVLEAQYHPISGSLSIDNTLGGAYQYESFSGQVALNAVLGLGEQIYVQASSGPDFEHLFSASSYRRILGAGAIVPLGDNGLTLNPEYTRVDTNPRPTTGATQITGAFERFAVRANYPLIRTRKQTLDVIGSFELDTERETAHAFDQTINLDKLRFVTIGFDWSETLSPRDSMSSELMVTQGLAGLGARGPADAAASGVPLSRQGSQPDFSKIIWHVRFDDRLRAGITWSNSYRGQVSLSGALPAAAQFSLDGNDSLSSFALGTLSVDSGITWRSELGRPMAIRGNALVGLVTPYGFSAFGFGHLSDPTALERANISSWAFGAGLRVAFTPSKARIMSFGSIEVSRGHASNFPSDATRVAANLTLRF